MSTKSRLSSNTYRVASVIAVLGVIETNLHLLQDLLGDYYGITYVGLAVVMMILREVTTKPLHGRDKDE